MIKEIGSIWRRWDFHIHTPYSLLNNGFGDYTDEKVWDNYIRTLYKKAIDNSIGAIFITDYFLINGYLKILNILKNTERLKKIFSAELDKEADYLNKVLEIAVFPNVEFRLSGTVGSSKIQFHVLFSNEISTSLIENNFLNNLHCNSGNANYSCNIKDIEDLGKTCIEKGIGVGVGGTPLRVGMNNFYVDLDTVIKALKGDDRFKNNYCLVCVEEDVNKLNWDGQSASIREFIYRNSHARFSASDSDIRWGVSRDCVDTIGHKLPCIFGSDAHDLDSLFYSGSKHYCWIKSDVTFKGFLDSLNCSEDRIFIGEIPDSLVKQYKRSAFSIKKVSIKSKTSEGEKHWICDSIPLNPSMVSIIGNKGSGKSALSDVIGLLGNSDKSSNYSFLSAGRFFHKSNPYSKDYCGCLEFFNGQKTPVTDIAYGNYDNESPGSVTYLPQSYIETTCNSVDKQFFIKEINKIIFDYLDDIEKDGYSNLEELVDFKFKKLDLLINGVKDDISALNKAIILKEKMKTASYRRSLLVSQKSIEKTIENHKLNKPSPVIAPKIEGDNRLVRIMNECSKLLESIENEHSIAYSKYKEKEKEYDSLLTIESKIKEINSNVDAINTLYKEHFEKYNPSIKTEIHINDINNDSYLKYKENLVKEFNAIRKTLLKNENSLVTYDVNTINIEYVKSSLETMTRFYEKRENLEHLIQLISKSVSDEQASYSQYLLDLKAWQVTLDNLEKGEEDNPSVESLKSIKQKLDYIDNQLDNDLNKLRHERSLKIEHLYNYLEEKNNELKKLYEPVQKQLDSVLINNSDKISFDSRIVPLNSLSLKIDDRINHRVNSSFKELSELSNLIINTDFNERESTVDFVDYILKKVASELDLFYTNLLKEESGQLDFYDFICCFNYLSIQYSLKMNGKPLEQLSPGEKGIVLLVFYLALDKDPKPLIIDQPEDNLDNQSIFLRLTSLIKYAKQNRQIIVVTHNPNIAVACDSEQIIYASIDQNTNKISYETGAIENPIISKHIVDVLEGTMPAFDFRKQKYR